MKLYATTVTRNADGVYVCDATDDGQHVNVTDTGSKVTVMEWQGTAYGSGEQVAMHNCTLYVDDNGVNYTTWDGDSEE